MVREFVRLFQLAFARWSEHNAPRLGASLAYYTLLSLAPLMILIVAICGVVFGPGAAEADVLQEAQNLVGTGGANAIKSLIENAHHPAAGIFASIVAFVTLFFGASGVFVELRDALNTIWSIPKKSSSVIRSLVWQRLASFAMVLGIGILLLTSLLLSAALAVTEKFFSQLFPIDPKILGAINFVASIVAIAILFALILKFVPEVPIRWADVGLGAAVTAVFFVIGKTLLGIYIGTAGVGSTYGAAGSLVALVVWVYYSAQIFLFGAVFTRVYAQEYGSRARGARPNVTARPPDGATPKPA